MEPSGVHAFAFGAEPPSQVIALVGALRARRQVEGERLEVEEGERVEVEGQRLEVFVVEEEVRQEGH